MTVHGILRLESHRIASSVSLDLRESACWVSPISRALRFRISSFGPGHHPNTEAINERIGLLLLQKGAVTECCTAVLVFVWK